MLESIHLQIVTLRALTSMTHCVASTCLLVKRRHSAIGATLIWQCVRIEIGCSVQGASVSDVSIFKTYGHGICINILVTICERTCIERVLFVLHEC